MFVPKLGYFGTLLGRWLGIPGDVCRWVGWRKGFLRCFGLRSGMYYEFGELRDGLVGFQQNALWVDYLSIFEDLNSM
jgi:hypothetical protein